ncbi:MAG TPA: glycosyltransferase family 39 protein [Blastocatellia bacterium]|nr:glycosyltransferase family 39 protein [Blastocatellia bacterium]
MTTSAEPLAESPDKASSINRVTVVKWFAIILAVSFILRIAYAGHLYEDDGLWFTAGEEILRGKALYREIYFDKPPGLPLVYAALFGVFGAHILTIRLFTILYTVVVSWVLYKFGSTLYDKRTGLLSAAMFAVFSTTYSTGHFQGFNTDLLMVLPYTAGALLMTRSRSTIGDDGGRTNHGWYALAGGVLAGVAFQVNPKGAFDLVFFAIILWTTRSWSKRHSGEQRHTEASIGETRANVVKRSVSAYKLFALGAAGFAAGSLPFLAYVGWTDSLASYWLYVWDWGARYGRYYPVGATLLATLTRSADYFALNNTLLVTLVFVAVSVYKRRRISLGRTPADALDIETASRAISTQHRESDSDSVLLIWFAVSFAGVMLGGRLFAHYFFQTLPSLCLIGARGLIGLSEAVKTRRPNLRRATVAVIAVGFLFTIVRFHGRSVMLLADWAGFTRSGANTRWYYEERNQEERLVAQVVTAPSESDSAMLDGSRGVGPRNRPVDGPADYLFVWGYRPEVYYWSGLLPASRYLSTQPLTGVPADVHNFGDDYRFLLPDDLTVTARAQLLRDLEETRPKYIVDELGFFNADLSITSYPELREFMTAYRRVGKTGRFFLYLRREFTKKYRQRHPKPD